MTRSHARPTGHALTPVLAPLRRLAVLGLLATLAACASVGPNRDVAQIDRLLADRGAGGLGWEKNGQGDTATADAWLAQPMTADLAVRMAMLRSPRLQRQFGELGLARADVLDAVQIANPRITFSRLAVVNGSGAQTAVGLAAPLLDLLALPLRARLGRQEYERARLQIAAALFDVSLDVEGAWYRTVAAQQVAGMRAAVATALQTSADLSQRYFDAGNVTELQLSREQAAASQARIAAARAAIDARVARLDLDNLIGLTGSQADWRPSAVLSLPVAHEDEPTELKRLAAGNLSLLAARRSAKTSADAAAITRRLRLLGSTTVGYDEEREVDHTRIRGPALDIELPIFNQGQARVTRARAQLSLARARLAELELNTANALDPAADRVKVLSDIVRIYRDALVPQRESVVARGQEEQNFMLIGIFEVIQSKTQEYDAYQGYLEAVRDYWLARIDLMRLIGARLPSEAQVSEKTPSVTQILAPPPGQAMDHAMHEGHGGAMPGMTMPDTAPPSQGGHTMAAHPAGHATPPMTMPMAAPPKPSPAPAAHHHSGDQP